MTDEAFEREWLDIEEAAMMHAVGLLVVIAVLYIAWKWSWK